MPGILIAGAAAPNWKVDDGAAGCGYIRYILMVIIYSNQLAKPKTLKRKKHSKSTRDEKIVIVKACSAK